MAEKPKRPHQSKKLPVVGREVRVMEVYDLLINEKSRSDILEHCSKKWDLGRASADNLMQTASKMIREDIESMRDSRLASIIKKQDELYDTILITIPTGKDSEGIPNFGAARQLLMDQAKLFGHDKQMIVHSIETVDEEIAAMSDEELTRELSQDDSA